MQRALLLSILVVVRAGSAYAQTPDPAGVLADVRKALGGDALASVESFDVAGKLAVNLGDVVSHRDAEWIYAAPDRFIEVETGSAARVTSGFNGEGLVYLRASTGREGGFDVPQRRNIPRDRGAAVARQKQAFARFVIAMLGVTPAYPLEAAYAGEDAVDKRPARVLSLKAPDGYEMRLYTDRATNLPLMVVWMAKPDLLVQYGSTFRGTAPKAPPGAVVVTETPQRDPTETMPPVERRLYFSDFELTAGLKWPHRMKETVDGVVVLERRLGTFKINSPVEPYRFVTVPRDR